jgi:hypothetical protein
VNLWIEPAQIQQNPYLIKPEPVNQIRTLNNQKLKVTDILLWRRQDSKIDRPYRNKIV